jgi:protein-disulfide isomerase
VFKQRPLPFHRFARPAARGSIAAGKQGKFWEYHDRLFAAERGFDDALFEETARVIGLDLDRWKRDYASAESEAVLAADEAEAQALEVRGTPTFFVNGKMIQGAQPIEEFERLIDAELAAR